VKDRYKERHGMVSEQIAARGVEDERVLEAVRRVPREAFLPEELRELAYEDTALPIGLGQTMSQPYIVAKMSEALELAAHGRDPADAVILEIGTGSGYAAAVLAEIAGRVITIERRAELAERARERLAASGYGRVDVIAGNGTRGHPEAAPYDGIVVAASGPEVPASLREQLAIGGRLVMPIAGTAGEQELVRVTRRGPDSWERESLGPVRFVPLVGTEGGSEDEGGRPR
jgi:protein-L-isoaspartate(D-aspartate) O-methyltransferase